MKFTGMLLLFVTVTVLGLGCATLDDPENDSGDTPPGFRDPEEVPEF